MANIITILRILCSIALLFCPVFSLVFYALYITAGVSDMLDGWVARRTHTTSELGAKLDTIADVVFVIVCLVRLLPVLDIPTWLAHNPIVAVDYKQRDAKANAGDAEYLSIGRSTWDNDTISAKIWRVSADRWSRQSEDIPLWRLLDLAILFTATLKEKPSLLGEVLINEADKQFLKEKIKENEDLYRPRLDELARLISSD